jgi:H+-transporting ATPase
MNDAPALKLADAGVAISGATAAARAAADSVLLNPGEGEDIYAGQSFGDRTTLKRTTGRKN